MRASALQYCDASYFFVSGEADVVEAVRDVSTAASYEYTETAPSPAALNHEFIHNQLASDLSSGDMAASQHTLAEDLPRHTAGTARNRTGALPGAAAAGASTDALAAAFGLF